MFALKKSDFESELYRLCQFLGPSDIRNRLSRLDQKWDGFNQLSSVFQKRYFFAVHLDTAIDRLSKGETFDFWDGPFCKFAAIVYSINRAKLVMSTKARASFRMTILDSLKPDRDFRQVEHELRVFTHYSQLGYSVKWADLEGVGSYDLLVTNQSIQFEVEAKTISDDIGRQIKAEDVTRAFKCFQLYVRKSQFDGLCGIVTLRLRDSVPPTEELNQLIDLHVSSGFAPIQYRSMEMTFDPVDHWKNAGWRHDVEGNFEARSMQEADDFHIMIIRSERSIVMFRIGSIGDSSIARQLKKIVKKAGTQCSSYRPAVIWLHFFGLSDGELRLLVEEAKQSRSSAFAQIASYTFSPESRDHVAKILISADRDEVRVHRPENSNVSEISVDGPMYEATNLKGKFPDLRTTPVQRSRLII